MKKDHQTYDSFVGKISPFLLFDMEYHSLSYVVENLKDDKFYSEINPSSQVASIGILAYFEAFCKHQFAAIVNIMPSLVGPFCHKRGEPTIEISTVAAFKGDFHNKIGFVLAEIYDFGTSKSINGIFYDLLGIKPFNSKEAKVFTSILNRRNLLVHHAGYYTLQYAKKKNFSKVIQPEIFRDSVRVDTEDYNEIASFLFEMAIKITGESVKSLKAHPDYKRIKVDSEIFNMVEELLRGIWDTIDDR